MSILNFLYTKQSILAPSFHVDLVSKMKTNPYTLATDWSNDSGFYPNESFDLKILDISLNKVTTNLLDMCTTKRATVAVIFVKK